jgi:NhaA family Na+:H+ antiporter
LIKPVAPSARRLFSPGSWPEARRVGDILRRETVGGGLLLAAALAALIWANSPWSATYERIRDTRIGPQVLHLNLDLAAWAADGLLAIFFFVAGLELKRELVAGDLRDRSRAAVPVAAAVGGVIAPAAIYLLVTWKTGGAARGWAIPTATDIAFALAVLAIVGRHLPTALRTFLLTLAVVDDLLAIVIIAIGYTAHLAVVPLLAILAPLGAFAWLVRGRLRRFSWVFLLPLAAGTWALVHASGVHATVAGVLLAFVVPVRPTPRAGGPGHGPDRTIGLAERLEHRLRPISAGLAVPVFALLATGVPIGGVDGLGRALRDPVALGIIAGLVVGKPLGIMAATWLIARFTRASLAEGLAWVDVLAIAICAGIGFTVSLLIGELAFGLGSSRDDHVTLAILVGSLVAGLAASVILLLRSRAHQRIRARELADSDLDGVPDVYQGDRADGRR